MKQLKLIEELIVDNFAGGGNRETNFQNLCLNHPSRCGQILSTAKISAKKKVKSGA